MASKNANQLALLATSLRAPVGAFASASRENLAAAIADFAATTSAAEERGRALTAAIHTGSGGGDDDDEEEDDELDAAPTVEPDWEMSEALRRRRSQRKRAREVRAARAKQRIQAAILQERDLAAEAQQRAAEEKADAKEAERYEKKRRVIQARRADALADRRRRAREEEEREERVRRPVVEGEAPRKHVTFSNEAVQIEEFGVRSLPLKEVDGPGSTDDSERRREGLSDEAAARSDWARRLRPHDHNCYGEHGYGGWDFGRDEGRGVVGAMQKLTRGHSVRSRVRKALASLHVN